MNTEELQAHLQQQQQEIALLQQQLQNFGQFHQESTRQAVDAAISAVLASNQTNKAAMMAKAAKPSTFDGSMRSNCDIWLFQMDTYLDLARVPEDQRVKIVGSYLKEHAALWYKYVYEESIRNGVILNWPTLRAQFLTRFRPIDSGKTARVALASLRQFGSVQQYCNLFQQHITQVSDMAEADKIFTFQRGLKQHVAREVDLRDPKTLLEAMHYAIRAEARTTLLNRSNFSSNFDFSSSRGNRSVPMEIDNVDMEIDSRSSEEDVLQAHAISGRPSSKRPEMSIADRERCVKEKRCFKCKQFGHSIRQCRNPHSSKF